MTSFKAIFALAIFLSVSIPLVLAQSIAASAATQQGRIYGSLTNISSVEVPGSTATYANGINNWGQIVGAYRDSQSGSNEIGFLCSNGAFSNVVFPGAAQTDAEGINDRGQIVGNYTAANSSYYQAFLDTHGTFVALNVPNAVNSAAYGINNDGQIAGYFIDAEGEQHGFLCSSQLSCSAVDFPGAAPTDFLGINNRGQVSGWYGTTDAEGGLVFDVRSGAFTTFSAPGSESTIAIGINDLGQVVGHFSVTGLPEQGFIYNDFSIFVLDVARTSNTYILGANKRQVVGLSDSGSFVAKVALAPASASNPDPATNLKGASVGAGMIYIAQKSAGLANGTNCANAVSASHAAPGATVRLCQTN